jgi:hypothetical protein
MISLAGEGRAPRTFARMMAALLNQIVIRDLDLARSARRHEVGIIRWPEIVENYVREEASFEIICRFRIDAQLPVAFYVDLRRGQGAL